MHYQCKVRRCTKGKPRSKSNCIGGWAHPSLRKAQPEYKDNASRGEIAVGKIAEYAIPAANAVPKYVLPAAGVTLAGQALVELVEMIGQQTEGAVMP